MSKEILRRVFKISANPYVLKCYAVILNFYRYFLLRMLIYIFSSEIKNFFLILFNDRDVPGLKFVLKFMLL